MDITPISIINIIAVILVVFFTNRMLRESSRYNWNPGEGDIQDDAKIKILTSIVAIAIIGIAAAAINIIWG